MAPRREITDLDRLFLLDTLTRPDHDLEYAAMASATGLDADGVRDIVAHHGWPDRAKIATAARMVRGKIERDRAAATGAPTFDVARVPARPIPKKPVEQRQIPTASQQEAAERAAATPIPEGAPAARYAAALTAGKASSVQSTRAAVERAEKALKHLIDKLAEDDAREREKAKAKRAAQEKARAKKAAQAAARAKVTELEQQLREARRQAGLTGNRGTDSRSVKIRAWAAETGQSCPARGRVPKRVSDAYDAAHA